MILLHFIPQLFTPIHNHGGTHFGGDFFGHSCDSLTPTLLMKFILKNYDFLN